MMPAKKWIVQYAVALPIVFAILAEVQYLKGRRVEYPIEFGVIWSCISVTTFAVRRYYTQVTSWCRIEWEFKLI